MDKIRLYIHARDIVSDLDTPVSLFLKINEPNSFLLESVTGGENVARYSFIGYSPLCEFRHTENGSEVTLNGNTTCQSGDPIANLKALRDRFDISGPSEIIDLFCGFVGYFSWETIGAIESIDFKDKEKTVFPMAHYIVPQNVVVFDHVKRQVTLILLSPDKDASRASLHLDALEKKLRQPLVADPIEVSSYTSEELFEKISSNYKKDDFKADVERAKQYIYEGDVFQLVLSQRFEVHTDKAPFDIYRALRVINPSPYMYYLNFPDYQIVGSSPEILTQLKGREATVRPIAGTRPRISGQEEALIKELVTDEKEKAEHVMLVDLGRNDLGRVSKYGTVKPSDMMVIEQYSHVLHMVTHVVSELEDDKDSFDLFKSTFPAGTLSGAPKIRAIEIIEEMEPVQRGPYGGALGVIGFNGDMDLCIIIRTVLVKNGHYYIQAGAGIVADSVPEAEFQETWNKARGMIAACI